ncbi:hypothetical protein Esti_003073 [Eimeria stiedai]
MVRSVTLFFSTRRGLEAPLLRELQAIPWLAKSAAAGSGNNAARGEAGLQRSPRPQEGSCRFVPSPGGVSVHRVPLSLVQQLCCNVRTAECVWLRLWGPVPCSTAEHLQSAIRSIPWKKYVSPLSALPLLPLRVASIHSPLSDNPSLRSALSLALEEAASAGGEAGPDADTAAGAAAPSALVVANRALVAAAHRLRIVCTRGQALADLQLSSCLDPRPYRYLPYVPLAAAAASTAQGTKAAPTVADELRLAALVAEAQRKADRGIGGVDPSWSLTSAATAAASSAAFVNNCWAGFGGAEGEGARSQHGSIKVSEGWSRDSACYSSEGSCANSSSSSNSNSIRNVNEPLTSACEDSGGPSSIGPLEGCSQRGMLPPSAATVSMLRLLYLKSGRVIESLAGLTQANRAAAAAADITAASGSMNAAAVWAAGRTAKEEGDVSLGAAAAAAGLRRIFRREKRIVLWDPFCSDGALLLEAALLLDELPASVPEVPCGLNLIPAVQVQQEDSKALPQQEGRAGAALAAATEGVPLITLVGTDERLLLLHDARQRLRNFCLFFYGGQMPMDLETQQQQLHRQEAKRELGAPAKPPFAMGLHEVSPFEVSSFVSGGIIFTRIPSPREAKLLPSARGKPFDFYEKIGQMISSRSDWRGVFVIAKGTSFQHYSRLEWEYLLKWRDVSGHKMSLIRWTGRKHLGERLETQQERLAALDSQDLEGLPFVEAWGSAAVVQRPHCSSQ